MSRFQVTGTARDTRRKRKRIYDARDDAEARLKADAEGIDVAEVMELPPEPPTENQIAYAERLGISVPAGATREELSDLISLRTENDKPAAPNLKALATGYGAKVTKYTGKKQAFQRIFEALTATPDRQQDLAAWFAYRVYRELVHGAPGTAIVSPRDAAMQEVARQLASQPEVMQSIRRYKGEDLVWFGQWTSPDGTVHQGGSNRTMAYKSTAERLRPIVAREKTRELPPAQDRLYDRPEPPPLCRAEPAAAGKGCFTVMVLGVGVLALISTATAAILVR